MKRIVILDDHCKEKYFYLLEDYLVAIDEYFKAKHGEKVEFIKCSDIKEFARAVLADTNNEYDGWIVDMMVPTEGLENYALLGRSDIRFNTARSGILALQAVINHDNPMNNLSSAEISKLAALARHPVLVFSILREANLARDINDVGINEVAAVNFFSASKAEIDVVNFKLPPDIESWCDKVVR